jgi:hypothetical protein
MSRSGFMEFFAGEKIFAALRLAPGRREVGR